MEKGNKSQQTHRVSLETTFDKLAGASREICQNGRSLGQTLLSSKRREKGAPGQCLKESRGARLAFRVLVLSLSGSLVGRPASPQRSVLGDIVSFQTELETWTPRKSGSAAPEFI